MSATALFPSRWMEFANQGNSSSKGTGASGPPSIETESGVVIETEGGTPITTET